MREAGEEKGEGQHTVGKLNNKDSARVEPI